MHYLLLYDLADDYLEKRKALRAEHLELAWKAAEAGDLMLGGALADPADSAVLLFSSDSPDAAEAFANADPYVRNGLVKSWRVREWTTVVGTQAATPVK
ncbi:MAG: YciI family protein [Bacteroidetes bacterium]|nr:YciI family protein [Bacteroidota bacterium]